jgi:hypothetical protein
MTALNRNETLLHLIEHYFHELIRFRAGNLVRNVGLELPSIETAGLGEAAAAWFPVPGMYGGFKYWFAEESPILTLFCESWCRVVDGSGQRHAIDAEGCRLIEQGFV